MKINVDRLSETPDLQRFTGSPEWWAEGCGGDDSLTGLLVDPLDFQVRIHRMGEDLYLEGEAEGELELTCGRCIARYRQPIRESYRLVLEPAGSRVPADPEGAAALARDGMCLGDELESGLFRGGEIDLAAFLREVVALLLPVQPVCREDCRGLCPQCGVDRNVDSCECAETSPASPFAVLGALRDELSGGKSS